MTTTIDPKPFRETETYRAHRARYTNRMTGHDVYGWAYVRTGSSEAYMVLDRLYSPEGEGWFLPVSRLEFSESFGGDS